MPPPIINFGWKEVAVGDKRTDKELAEIVSGEAAKLAGQLKMTVRNQGDGRRVALQAGGIEISVGMAEHTINRATGNPDFAYRVKVDAPYDAKNLGLTAALKNIGYSTSSIG